VIILTSLSLHSQGNSTQCPLILIIVGEGEGEEGKDWGRGRSGRRVEEGEEGGSAEPSRPL